ncbi:MAG TPA: carbohydrate kinase [Micromonosporaceae bacterium]|nr:carbohydrate kinase [Micromonosporaceae bacterium]
MITVVGESLLDLVADTEGRCFAAYPGGSPANVAVGLARLGTPVRLVTHLADDLPGRLVARHLRDSGVTVDLLPGSPATSLALAAVDEHGVASYDFRISWDVARVRDLGSDCRHLHTGSIAGALPPGADVVDELLAVERRRGRVTISLDPNIRASLLGHRDAVRERLERQVSRSDVVKASTEDLAWLYPGEPPDRVAARWLAAGLALVVVTLGSEGGYGLSRAAEVTRPAVPVTVVDTVGAGDAFTAGLLDGLSRLGLLGGDQRGRLAAVDAGTLAALLDFAIRVAGLTCGRSGADPPTRDELAQS